MKTRIRILIGIVLALSSLSTYASCSDDELTFAFANIKAVKAFSLLSGFAGLSLDIDNTITESGPIKFDCMHWQEAASFLADEFDLKLKIAGGVMRVRR